MIQIMLWKYSLLRCHHQNHYWNVITKFVYEMSSPNDANYAMKILVTKTSSPKSLLKCHHQMIQIMLWKYSLLRCYHQNRYWCVITKIVSEMSSPKSLLNWNVITKSVSKTLSPTRLVSEMLSPNSLVKCHHHIQISQKITTKNLKFYWKNLKNVNFKQNFKHYEQKLVKYPTLRMNFCIFKGMWELWECQNWILDGFLSWKMVSELQNAGKFWVFLRKKAS